MTYQFQVGDHVERTLGSHGQGRMMQRGDRGIITYVSSSGRNIVIKGYGRGHSPDSLKLIPQITKGNTMSTYTIYRYQYEKHVAALNRMPEDLTKGLPIELNARRLETFLKRTEQVIVSKTEVAPNHFILELASTALNGSAELQALISTTPTTKSATCSPNYYGDAKADFLALVQNILVPEIDKDVELVSCGVSVREYNPIRIFKVYSWATPDMDHNMGRLGKRSPTRLFERRVYDRSEPFRPSGKGLPIMHGDYCLGELFENALYIHHSACASGDEDTKIIFATILQQAAALHKSTDFSKLEEKLAELRTQEEMKALQTFVHNSANRNKLRADAQVKAAQKEIRELREKLGKLHRDVAHAQANIGDIDFAAYAVMEYQKLKEFDKVESVKFYDNELTVITNPITSYCKHDDCYYNLGRVKLVLPFGTRDYLCMYSADDQYKRMPHSDGDSHEICLGNAYEEIMAYAANFEMMTLVAFMIAFLTNGIDTEDEWGQYLKNFPHA